MLNIIEEKRGRNAVAAFRPARSWCRVGDMKRRRNSVSRRAIARLIALLLVAGIAAVVVAVDHPASPVELGWPIAGGLGEVDYGMSAPTEQPGTAVVRIFSGTPVVATQSGQVTVAGEITGAPELGLCIVIRDNRSGVFTRYSNLGTLDCMVGDHVNTGDRIGWVGSQRPDWPEDAVGFDLWIGDIRTNPLWYFADATSAATGE